MYKYELKIEAKYIDAYGHVNNAAYLEILEKARWKLLEENGYSLDKIQSFGIGPVILEINIKFINEIKLNDIILIETDLPIFKGKIGKLSQRMLREDKLCCTADFTMAFFDLKKRKIIEPDAELLKLIGHHS